MGAVQMRLPEGANEHSTTVPRQLLITAKQAALCGKSLRTWRAWDAAGWIPRPVHRLQIGRCFSPARADGRGPVLFVRGQMVTLPSCRGGDRRPGASQEPARRNRAVQPGPRRESLYHVLHVDQSWHTVQQGALRQGEAGRNVLPARGTQGPTATARRDLASRRGAQGRRWSIQRLPGFASSDGFASPLRHSEIGADRCETVMGGRKETYDHRRSVRGAGPAQRRPPDPGHLPPRGAARPDGRHRRATAPAVWRGEAGDRRC